MIDPVEKPAHCAPQGTGDCRYYDYHGDREPVYDDIRVHSEGRISFIVGTKTFKDVTGLTVSSEDAGETWKVDPIEPEDRTPPIVRRQAHKKTTVRVPVSATPQLDD